jgi:hypothetical protein
MRESRPPRRTGWSAVFAFAVLALAACSDPPDPPPGPPALFPVDYAESYEEVRDCRQSGDHDLNIIRILADPAALGPYLDRDAPFPVGAVVLKEEYDFTDNTCEGPIKQWTLMARLADESSPTTLDWRWQRIDAARNVVAEDEPRCYGCHTGCTADAGGYDFTCAVP